MEGVCPHGIAAKWHRIRAVLGIHIVTTLMQFVAQYGVVFVFVYVLVQQAGRPLPEFPVRMAAGTPAACGELAAFRARFR